MSIDLHAAALAIHFEKCMRYKFEPYCTRHACSWRLGDHHCPNCPTDLLNTAQQLLVEARAWRGGYHTQQLPRSA